MWDEMVACFITAVIQRALNGSDSDWITSHPHLDSKRVFKYDWDIDLSKGQDQSPDPFVN